MDNPRVSLKEHKLFKETKTGNLIFVFMFVVLLYLKTKKISCLYICVTGQNIAEMIMRNYISVDRKTVKKKEKKSYNGKDYIL